MVSYSPLNSSSSFSALSPYPIPKTLIGRKVVNLGDGIILRAIERLVGRFNSQLVFSPRIALSPDIINILEHTPAVLLAGANQLNDRYTVWPGLNADRIRSGKLRLVPFGIGLHGEAGYTEGLSETTKDIFRALHERVAYSSWRCPNTVAFLNQELPDLAPQFLMTGCPVIYDEPLLSERPFHTSTRRIAVTVTERNDFWIRETALIDFVANHFRRSERYLVLHQNFSPPDRLELFRHRWFPGNADQLNQYQKLRRYAVRRGFRVVCPDSADACIAFYKHIDQHFGSRLHAHLLFLSQAKRSWLVPVDGRSVGIADFLGFPLCQPDELAGALDFDFNVTRELALSGYKIMCRFLSSLPK